MIGLVYFSLLGFGSILINYFNVQLKTTYNEIYVSLENATIVLLAAITTITVYLYNRFLSSTGGQLTILIITILLISIFLLFPYISNKTTLYSITVLLVSSVIKLVKDIAVKRT